MRQTDWRKSMKERGNDADRAVPVGRTDEETGRRRADRRTADRPFEGPNRRSGKDRRDGTDRRKAVRAGTTLLG
jgi:hypothetical protein